MPQRFFAVSDLREYGLTPGDVRGKQHRRAHETWDLPANAVNILKTLLERVGFDTRLPIHVHETSDPPIFVLTQ